MISENLWQPWIYNCQIFGLLLAMILIAYSAGYLLIRGRN